MLRVLDDADKTRELSARMWCGVYASSWHAEACGKDRYALKQLSAEAEVGEEGRVKRYDC
jgi:hypothetical protein